MNLLCFKALRQKMEAEPFPEAFVQIQADALGLAAREEVWLF